MSAENVVVGHATRVEINGVIFPKISCDWNIERAVFNNKDDVSGPFHKSKQDGARLTASISFQEATDLNVYAPPFNVFSNFNTGDTIYLKIYTRGLDYQPIDCPIFTITRGNGSANSQNGGVNDGISGESYGQFTLPDDAQLV